MSAVQKAIATGRITKNADGTIDPERADREWAQNTFSGAALSNRIGNPKVHAPVPAVETVPQHAPGGADPVQSYLRARAVKETFNAKRAQAEYELLSGKLMETSKAGAYAVTFSSLVKEHWMAMAERLAPSLAALGDEAAVRKVLQSDVEIGLKKLNKAIQDAGF